MVDERETTTTTTTTEATTTVTTTTSEEGPGTNFDTTTTTTVTEDIETETRTTTTTTSTTTTTTTTIVTTVTVDVNISKANTLGEEVEGASLTLTGKDDEGNDVVFDITNIVLGNGAVLNTTENGTEINWTSGSTSTLIKGLGNGTYTLHEVAAPDGYEVTTDITFTIRDGEITGTNVSGNTVTMVDTMKGEAQISKTNVYGEEIAGAKLTLTGKDNNGNDIVLEIDNVILGQGAELVTTENGTSLTWISGTSGTFVKNLPNGTYTLHEEAAPSGYLVTTDITFTVNDGVVEGGEEVTGNTITMEDDMMVTDVEISKKSVFGDELSGAKLTLTGKDLTGRTVTFDVDDVTLGVGATLEGTGNSLTWISGSTSTFVKDLTDGTYTLHEIAAPNGYEVATDITFTIINGQVTGEVGVDGNTVTMIDDAIVIIDVDVEISKQNIFGKELAGAKITLTGKDNDGNDITFDITDVTAGRNAEILTTENGTEITWISGDTPTFIGGLTDGTYTLHEVAAPSGYEVTTDIIFTVENGQVTGTNVSGDTVTIIDDMTLTDVNISKKSVLGDEIAGAQLTLTGVDFEGNEVVFDLSNVTLGTEAELISTENTKELTWISGTSSTLVGKLTDGTYVLHEVAAPSGFEVATDITFTIENGVVTGVIGVETDSNTVTMIDDMVVTTTTTTTTTTDTTTTTTTTTTATTTKAAATTATASTNAPKTGVAGMGSAILAMAIAAATAFAARKRKDEE